MLERLAHWLDGHFVHLDMRRRCQCKDDRMDNILGLQHGQPLVMYGHQIRIHQARTNALHACEEKA